MLWLFARVLKGAENEQIFVLIEILPSKLRADIIHCIGDTIEILRKPDFPREFDASELFLEEKTRQAAPDPYSRHIVLT